MPLDISQDKGANAISYSRAIARQLGLQEKDIRLLLLGTGISTESFIYSENALSNSEQLQVFRNALSVSRDLSLGLRIGHSLTPPAHGAMGFLANCSPTLMSALNDFKKYLPIRVGFGRLDLHSDDHHTECLLTVIYKQDPLVYRMISEAFAISLISLAENILGAPLEQGELHFNFPQPDYYDHYQQYIHCPIHFDAEMNRLVLPRALTDVINVSSDYPTYEHSLAQCNRLLQEIDAEVRSVHQRLRKLILSRPRAHLSEEEAAAFMFISKRTLARRLDAEGTSFRQIRDDVIASLARGYLTETNLAIETIASMLDYHDSSSFRRAFKRLHGVTPNAFRHRDPPPGRHGDSE